MYEQKVAPTESTHAARACLLRRHTENELAALLLNSELRRIQTFLREVLEAFDWVQDTRAHLTSINDPPHAVEVAIALGVVTEADAAPMAEVPGSAKLIAQLNAARELAESVRRARQLLPRTTMFGRRKSGPDKLKAFAKMPAADLIAALLLVAERAGFSPKFTATEAMAFAVLAGIEPPTVDADQRLNTWSKRLLRVAKHVHQSLVDLGRVLLAITARRVTTLADAEAVQAKLRNAVRASSARQASPTIPPTGIA